MKQTQSMRFAVLNGRLLERAAIAISPFSDGFMFGCGVFETLKVTNGSPEFWVDHQTRLERGMTELGLVSGLNPGVRSRCEELIRAEGAREAVLKIVMFQDEGLVSELILLRDFVYTEEHYKRGFSLKVVAGRTSGEALSRLKTQNYLCNLLALRSAKAEGFDEVIFVDGQERVFEGATANIFAVRNDILYTPPLVHGILPGVVRGRLLKATELAIKERTLTVYDLKTADEVFLSNSVFGIMPVREIQGQGYDDFSTAERCRSLLASH